MPARPITKILIANRGEIAIRVIRACRELGIKTVAVYSEADANGLHVRMADEAYLLGPAPSRESYLNMERVLDAVKKSGADAVHPGFGFLSENAAFADAVSAMPGVTFIGPPASAMIGMGEKTSARRLMHAAGVPVVPGTLQPVQDMDEIRREAERIGFPLMLKAAAGGGGKGMRRVERMEDLESAYLGAVTEAKNSFGDDSVYMERYLEKPRHVEIQIFADEHGNAAYVFERECSIQRRHQKIVEESPSPVLTPEMREAMGAMAVRAAKAVNYVGAGTVECLVDAQRNYYFLEMNTRLQVEHPVSEEVSGLDLVHEQIRVAQGEKLSFSQEDLKQRGHAIEVRIYAEDPSHNFSPSPGTIEKLLLPMGPGVRNEVGVDDGAVVSPTYDPMLGKLIVKARDRQTAIDRMLRALSEYTVLGITTNITYLKRVLEHPKFREGDYDTGFIPAYLPDYHKPTLAAAPDEIFAALAVSALEQSGGAAAKPSGAADGATDEGATWRNASRPRGFA
jgi:acetyl-CoA carboxylase, biotin carboxylase subunit